jgi:hypothetical protein
MRSFVVVFLAGVAVLAAVGLLTTSGLVYSDGVNPVMVAAELDTGDRACQAPLRLPTGAAFDRVGFQVGTYGEPGPRLRIEVLEDAGGRRLATGRLPAGYADLGHQTVEVGRVQADEPLRICFVNEDRGRAGIIGQVGVASPPTSATLNHRPIENDLTVELRTAERPLLAWLPEAAERASVFRAGWVTPAVYWALAAGVLVLAPVLLARGIGRAAADDR